MNKIKLYITSLILVMASLLAPLALTSVAVAAYDQPGAAACGGASGTTAGTGSTADCQTSGGTKLPNIVKTIINWFSWIVGAISVIMIIYGGFRYITSGGDQNGVTAAKNTLLYAVVGLIVVALAQIIVNFVLNAANTAAQ